MFHSFFPRPRLFLFTFVTWALFCVILWFSSAQDLGRQFSIGAWFGFDYPAQLEPPAGPEPDSAAKEGAKPPQPTAEQVAFKEQVEWGDYFWFFQYTALCYLIFVFGWMAIAKHKWAKWSVIGSAFILFTTWFQVHIDVLINGWFGEFYNAIQRALTTPGSVSATEYYGYLMDFLKLAMLAVFVSVVSGFMVSHYVFRWRTAMNDYYASMWDQVRHIEGASQRIQEDTMRFASITESLGVRFIDSIMTLIAFLPILWGFSKFVSHLPIIGAIPQSLVVIAILWSVFGTMIVGLAGIKLPGLNFKIQRVEAAYRKELVYGEDDGMRAQPPTLRDLYGHVRRNYFSLYLHYLYFNVVRGGYLQLGVMVPYIALGPTLIAGGALTLGIWNQILRAFGRVENSFQFLINSWSTIVELMSIYKRLKAFEAAINDQPLPKIDQEYLSQPGN